MNELISTKNVVINNENVSAVNARELWKFLEVGRDFSNWFKNRVKEYGFEYGVDFCTPDLASKNGSGGHNRKDYFITFDMAKELAMVENNERGKEARQYFIEVEKRYRTEIRPQDVQRITAVLTPILEEKAQMKMELDFARHFLPHGNPGELNRKGNAKTRFRRGYYTAGKGRNLTALIERYNQPGLFDEFELKRLT